MSKVISFNTHRLVHDRNVMKQNLMALTSELQEDDVLFESMIDLCDKIGVNNAEKIRSDTNA